MATKQREMTNPATMLADAEASLQDIRKRIGANDPAVTVDDLTQAEAGVRFSQMRITAAAEAEAQRQEQARRDRVAEIRASLPVIFDKTKLDAARQGLEAALDAYCTEAERIERGFIDVYDELIRMPPSGISVQASAYAPAIGGYRKPNFSDQVTTAVAEAFRRHGLTYEQGR